MMISPVSIRTFRPGVAVALVAVALSPGCSCGVFTALAALERVPSPVLEPLPALTREPTVSIAGTTAAYTSVSAEIIGRGAFAIRALEESEQFSSTLELAEGENTIFVAATNGAGVTSPPVGPVLVVVDTIAPDAPVFVDVPTQLVVGPGDIPLETVLQVDAGADCVLDVDQGGVVLPRTAVTASDTGFIVAVDLVAGENRFDAICVDAAGNESGTTTATIEVVVDATAPAPPVVEPLSIPLVFDAPATTASATLQGTKPGGSLLVVDGVVQTAAGASETWSLDVTLEEGDHVILLSTENERGTRSDTVTVSVPVRRRPDVPLPDPLAGLTNQSTFTLTGTRCAVGHRIFATTTPDGSGDASLAGVCEAFQVGGVEVGRFSVGVVLQEGDNGIHLYAERDLGVQSRRVGPLTVTLDTVAPAPPLVTFPACAASEPRTCNAIIGAGETAGLFSLSGERDAADVIDVNGIETVGGDSTWSAEVSVAANATTTVTVKARDPAGNESAAIVVSVVPVAGLASPTLQCLGPYRFSGNLAACPILLTAIPASRRAVRGEDVVLRGNVAVSGQRLRVCAVPASLGTVEDPCAPGTASSVVEPIVQVNRSFVATLPGSVLTAGTNFFIQSFNDVAVSAFVGPNVLRRDDRAPAAPSALEVSDQDGRLTGTPLSTRFLDVNLAGSKDIDGDVCYRQALVSETCSGGVCVFSPCLLLAGADGLTTWGGPIRLLGGVNRVCVESSDVVPANGEVVNPGVGAGERQFVGNVSAESCVDIAVAVDPGPVFVQPLDDSLVRPGRFLVKLSLDDPLDLTTEVQVCVNDAQPCDQATENVEDGLWEAEVQLPSGALGETVDLRALVLVGAELRGETVVSARLIPPQQLVSDTGAIVANDFMTGRISPRAAGGISGELVTVWEDDCFLRSSPQCAVRNTSGSLQNSPAPSIFLRRLVAGTWQRTVNVSDDARVAESTEPVVAVDVAGVAHVLWIDNGFGDEQGTLVHRTLAADLISHTFSPTVQVSADFENALGLKELDFRPSVATGPGGEAAVAWVKQRDAAEGGEGTRYVAFAVQCSIECGEYASQATRAPGVWSAAVQISPQGSTPLDNPAIALDAEAGPERKAWVAWNLRLGSTQVLQIRDVPLDPAVAIPASIPLAIPTTGVTAASRPVMAMDPSGILHIVWNATDGVRYTSLDTVPDSPGFGTFSANRRIAAHEGAALASTADVIATSAGRATVVVSMTPQDDLCFASPPPTGSLRLVDVDPTTVTTTSLAAGRSTLSPRIATLRGGSAAVVYEVDACAANGDIASNSFLDVVPLP